MRKTNSSRKQHRALAVTLVGTSLMVGAAYSPPPRTPSIFGVSDGVPKEVEFQGSYMTDIKVEIPGALEASEIFVAVSAVVPDRTADSGEQEYPVCAQTVVLVDSAGTLNCPLFIGTDADFALRVTASSVSDVEGGELFTEVGEFKHTVH